MSNLNGGYAMIKYNSTQEELQIAYRSKKPALFYDENQRAHWAVIEETATKSVDEETQEPITLYEYSYRLIDEASGGSTLDDIVDSKGNKRFVEGAPTFVLNSGYNIVSDYQKWSLSGTHLMIVGVLTSIGGTNLSGQNVYELTLPSWIFSKILTFPNSNIVSKVSALTSNTSASMTALLKKDVENNKLYIIAQSELKNNITCRIQFDLLIDSE